MQLPHLASRLYGTPLLLASSKLDIILGVLGERIQWPAPQLALPVPAPRIAADAPGEIAVIPVYGTLVRRALGLEAASGLTSYGEVGAMLDAALSDPAVSGILLDVDSPGGEAGGVFELAQRIRAADAVKPVWVIASDSAFSAAYAIACAASRIYVTQTGGVGSIGIIAMHVDQSVRDAQEGYRYTAITAGEQKNDLSPHQPLDKESSARLQSEVDRIYTIFVDHVAVMRGLEPHFVRSTQAGIYFGPDAVTAGLADVQGDFDAAVSDFTAFLMARRVRNTAAHNVFASVNAPSDPTFSPTPMLPRKEALMTAAITDVNTNPTSPAKPPEPEGAPATPPAPAQPEIVKDPGAGVEDAVNAAAKTARADALEIAELCQLAGQPQRITAFLAQGTSATQVRRTLLESRTQSQEITSLIHPDAVAKASSPEQNPLMQAVKKLTAKE